MIGIVTGFKSRSFAKLLVSERHACRLVGLSRDIYRNPPEQDQLTRDVCERIWRFDSQIQPTLGRYFKPLDVQFENLQIAQIKNKNVKALIEIFSVRLIYAVWQILNSLYQACTWTFGSRVLFIGV